MNEYSLDESQYNSIRRCFHSNLAIDFFLIRYPRFLLINVSRDTFREASIREINIITVLYVQNDYCTLQEIYLSFEQFSAVSNINAYFRYNVYPIVIINL